MLTIELEAKVVWGLLRHDYGEGVGFRWGVQLFVPSDELKELYAVAQYLDDEWNSYTEEDNYRFGSEEVFVQWYEFEKSLPDSPYFKGREALLL